MKNEDVAETDSMFQETERAQVTYLRPSLLSFFYHGGLKVLLDSIKAGWCFGWPGRAACPASVHVHVPLRWR
jgi:hypothetical protein